MKIFSFILVIAAPMLGLAQAADSVAANEALIRQHHERLNHGDVKTAVLDYDEVALNHGKSAGREGLRHVLEDIFVTFPDWRMDIVEMVAAGNTVVVRCAVSGTHRGVGKLPVNGALLMNVSPTEKRFEVQHIHWYTLQDGKIIEHRANRDDVGMMRQLGLLPPLPAPAALK